jgi:hypothetical protein
MALNLDKKQKWGIGLLASAATFGIVGGLAVAKIPMPDIVLILFGAVEPVLIYFGIKSFIKPPTEPPVE